MASSISQRERSTILLAYHERAFHETRKSLFATAALSLAALGATAARAAGVEVLNEGFEQRRRPERMGAGQQQRAAGQRLVPGQAACSRPRPARPMPMPPPTSSAPPTAAAASTTG